MKFESLPRKATRTIWSLGFERISKFKVFRPFLGHTISVDKFVGDSRSKLRRNATNAVANCKSNRFEIPGKFANFNIYNQPDKLKNQIPTHRISVVCSGVELVSVSDSKLQSSWSFGEAHKETLGSKKTDHFTKLSLGSPNGKEKASEFCESGIHSKLAI